MLFSPWALLFLTLTKAEQHSPQPVFQNNICPSVAALWGSEIPAPSCGHPPGPPRILAVIWTIGVLSTFPGRKDVPT